MGFLIFLIIVIILAPYIGRGLMWLLGFVARRHIEKQTRQMQDAFARAAGLDPEEVRRKRQQEEKVRDHGGWTSPAPKKKKIDPEEAEYVKFKEITVEKTATRTEGSVTSDTDGTAASFVAEEQVTDVTWTDIK